MPLSLKDIAASLGAQTLGDDTLLVGRLAEPARAGEGDLALAIAPRFAADLKASKARAAVVWAGADLEELGLRGAIVGPSDAQSSRVIMAGLTRMLDDDPTFAGAAGIHSTAVIDPNAQIAPDAVIGPFVVIAAGVQIGPKARIAAHVTIAPAASIGAGATLYAGVRIGARVVIGSGFIAQPNVVIGADGFSFSNSGPSNVERAVRQRGDAPLAPPDDGTWHKIHSLGTVIIGDNVEVGANSTIDAGTVRATEVGSGTKIDNLVQVGHNVIVGRDCLLCAQAAIAGSTRLGDRVIMGGKSGVADNLTVGRDVVIGGGAIVLSSVADGLFVAGHPAKPSGQHRAEQKALRNLTLGRKAP